MESIKKPTNLRACCVKFSEYEWNRVTKDREAFRLSIPKLLKAAYFKREIRRYLMCEQNEKILLAQWHTVRSQIEEVSKRIETQSLEVVPSMLERIREHLQEIHGLMVAYHIKQL
ncbi:MAG: hypothetical protein AB1540_00325 [Bdellovibrionota bacterium]